MKRSARISAALLSSMLLLGACGGGGDDDQASSATTQPTTATTGPTGSTVSGGIVSDALLAQRCVNYAGFVGAIGLSLAAAVDPNAARQLEELKAKMDLGDAPDEIKADVAVMTAYAEDLGKVLAKYNLQSGTPDPEAIAAIAQFSQTVDNAGLQKASDKISAWLSSHCPGS
jgi:hypothetical protein